MLLTTDARPGTGGGAVVDHRGDGACDNHLDEPHIHVDHQYVAIADSPVPVSEPVHPFAWFSAEKLDDLPMFEDTLLLARTLFPCIGSVAAAAEHDGAAMLRTLSAAGPS